MEKVIVLQHYGKRYNIERTKVILFNTREEADSYVAETHDNDKYFTSCKVVEENKYYNFSDYENPNEEIQED